MQNEEKEHRVGDVEDDVREMMTGRVKPVNLAIKHVRKPSQRMPIADVITEGPGYSGAGQALFNLGVFGDVLLVVVPKKIMAQAGQINREGEQSENSADENLEPYRWRSVSQSGRGSCENKSRIQWQSIPGSLPARAQQCAMVESLADNLQRLGIGGPTVESSVAVPEPGALRWLFCMLGKSRQCPGFCGRILRCVAG